MAESLVPRSLVLVYPKETLQCEELQLYTNLIHYCYALVMLSCNKTLTPIV